MRKSIVIILAASMVLFLAACSSSDGKTVFDLIKESPAAKMELPDGSFTYVDSEISSLRSFADLELRESPVEPADSEEDWLYRIVFNPAGKVEGTDEITVSFHGDYVQIDTEYYLPKDGVSYESILDWAASKYEYFMGYSGK